MKATVVVDNISAEGLKGEWGLCIYIEYRGKKILLDTGASPLFVQNAKALNLSIEDVDIGVLSHAHYDHGNGLGTFLETNKKATFYLQDGCEENCYARKWIFRKYIGLPKGVISTYRQRIKYASGNYPICEGVSLVSHQTEGLESIGKREGMYLKLATGWAPDNFCHEQSLVFDTTEGLVIFNSCSHGGVINIIREVSAAYPGKKVIAYIGGFHLYNKPEDEVRRLARGIKETGIKYIYTGHCTGKHPFTWLQDELGQMVQQLRSGLVMEFDDIDICQAQEEDLEAILKLQYLAYESEARLVGSNDIPPLKQTLAEVEAEYANGIFLKAVNNQGQIVGSVRGYVKAGTLYIGKLMVHPDWQRKGIGSRLLREIESVYPKLRCELFTGTLSEKNIKLYEGRGYVRFKTKVISPKLEFVYLEKTRGNGGEQRD